MGFEGKFTCPVIDKPCVGNKCAWWGKKEKNCAARILARLPNFDVDPFDAVFMGKKDE